MLLVPNCIILHYIHFFSGVHFTSVSFQECSTVSFQECISYLFSSGVYFTSDFPGVLNWEDGGSLDLGGMGLSRTDSRMSRVVMVSHQKIYLQFVSSVENEIV